MFSKRKNKICCLTILEKEFNMNVIRNIYLLLISFLLIANVSAASYSDVESNLWYSDAVDFVSEKGWMIGTTETEFSAEKPLNRAMFVTVLYRMAGSPNGYYPHVFIDVPETEYYSKAVSWAYANDIVNGTSGKTFSPYRNITREEMITILYRYISPQNSSTNAVLVEFHDYQEISDYAVDAMVWAVSSNLIKGTSDIYLSPQSKTNRAQCATIIWRFYEKVMKRDKDFYNVKDYGVIGDGLTDDTEAINDLIKKAPDGSTIYFPDGTYLVSANGGVSPGKWVDINHNPGIWIDSKNDIIILLSSKATIKLLPTEEKGSHVLLIYNSHGVTICGGHIEGDRNTYTGSMVTEWCHGISAKGSSDISISNIKISQCRGDGIGIGTGPTYHCENITIDSAEIYDCFRNGITLTSCQNVVIKNTNVYNIYGTAPEAGIDVEPEYENAFCKDIVVKDCRIDGNKLSIAISGNDNIQILNSKLPHGIHAFKNTTNVFISNCELDRLALSDSVEASIYSSNMCSILFDGGTGYFNDCYVTPSPDAHAALHIATDGANAGFDNCTFNAPETQNEDFYTFRCYNSESSVSFNNCTIHLDCLNVGNPFAATVGFGSFKECVFVNSHSMWEGLFLNIRGKQIELYDCVFDASSITEYKGNGNSFLISICANDVTVQGCTILTANNNSFVPCRFAFYSKSDICTGTIQYINNTLLAWNDIGLMPTDANCLVISDNIFKP